MALTPAQFWEVATEFAELDEAQVQRAIDSAERRVNRTAWGAKADDGVLYLAAHLLTQDRAQGAAPAGPLQSVAVDGVSKTYAVNATAPGDDLSTTAWGRRFLALRREVFSGRVV